jgi:septal ring factor EnvC (AmiA/AmiB activator)
MTLQKHVRGWTIAVLSVSLVFGGFFMVQQHERIFADLTADAVEARKKQLQGELETLQRLIAQQQVLLNEKQGERVTLERDLDILDAEIEKARLNIQASELAIQNLGGQIQEKEKTIQTIDEEIDREKASLAQILRRTAEMDDISLVELVFSEQTISEFFEELNDFDEIKTALHASFTKLENLRSENDVARLTQKRYANNKNARSPVKNKKKRAYLK